MVEDHAALLSVQGSKKLFEKNAVKTKAIQQLTLKSSELTKQLDIYRICRKELGLDEDIEFDEDEIKDVAEVKILKKAKDFFDGVKRVYVTFASMKTKLVVERYLKRTNYRKALRLPQYCCK